MFKFKNNIISCPFYFCFNTSHFPTTYSSSSSNNVIMKLRYDDIGQTQPFVRIVVCLVYQAINQIVQTGHI